MTTTQPPTAALPQLQGRPMVTDGGMETDLIFHHGVDLPCFAAFPLLDSAEGCALLTHYYDAYATIAEEAGAGLLLETPTWRANPDWGHRLGYGETDLSRLNTAAVTLVRQTRRRHPHLRDVVVSGMIGPRGDGYSPARQLSPHEAYVYHRPQIATLAAAGADMVTAYTLTHPGEAVGIVRAARAVGVPVAISFTVEVDGRLPNGETMRDAITQVDDSAAPDYYLINCAHPTHFARALEIPGDTTWRVRIIGVRSNASDKSHAELDDAEELDEGDPDHLAAAHQHLVSLLPHLVIIGGCCGTDARHVAALWHINTLK